MQKNRRISHVMHAVSVLLPDFCTPCKMTVGGSLLREGGGAPERVGTLSPIERTLTRNPAALPRHITW